MGWTMRGTYTEIGADTVGFTWSWDHEPDAPARSVRVTTATENDHTLVTITHGDYGPDDAGERQGHIDGWTYFLPRLAALLATNSADDTEHG